MTVLDSDDCGWVATLTVLDQSVAATDTCKLRHFVVYMQRRAAPVNDMLLCEDLGDRLGPPIGTLPGDKEGIIQLRAEINAITVIYTGRGKGDAPDAPFALRKETVPVPGIWPCELAALMRIRNMARILDDTDLRFAPYAK